MLLFYNNISKAIKAACVWGTHASWIVIKLFVIGIYAEEHWPVCYDGLSNCWCEDWNYYLILYLLDNSNAITIACIFVQDQWIHIVMYT